MLRIDKHRHIPDAICVIECRCSVSVVRPREQAANPAGILDLAAQVLAAGVGDDGCVQHIAFLDHEISVVDVADFVGQDPGAALRGEFLADTPTHFAVIRELGFPCVRGRDFDQLVLVIVDEGFGAIVNHVPVLVVDDAVGSRQVGRNDIRIDSPQTVFGDCGKGVGAVYSRLVG